MHDRVFHGRWDPQTLLRPLGSTDLFLHVAEARVVGVLTLLGIVLVTEIVLSAKALVPVSAVLFPHFILMPKNLASTHFLFLQRRLNILHSAIHIQLHVAIRYASDILPILGLAQVVAVQTFA